MLYATHHLLLVLLLYVAVFLIPIAKILSRAGWNVWLSLLWAIPLLNLIMLWVFAFGDWPNLPQTRAAP